MTVNLWIDRQRSNRLHACLFLQVTFFILILNVKCAVLVILVLGESTRSLVFLAHRVANWLQLLWFDSLMGRIRCQVETVRYLAHNLAEPCLPFGRLIHWLLALIILNHCWIGDHLFERLDFLRRLAHLSQLQFVLVDTR